MLTDDLGQQMAKALLVRQQPPISPKIVGGAPMTLGRGAV